MNFRFSIWGFLHYLENAPSAFHITHKTHPRHQTPTMAKVLGNITPPTEFPLIYSPTYLGDIEPRSLKLTDDLVKPLADFASGKGLEYKKVIGYATPCLLPLSGSILEHEDWGMGTVLSWMIDIRPINAVQERNTSGDYVELFVSGMDRLLRIKSGDVFIFDPNVHHAWISNMNCMLVQLTVSEG